MPKERGKLSMPDPTTREKISYIIKERCPLRTVLRPEKACPYFGPSESCQDCVYNWMVIASTVLKLASIRRASYEKEQEKVIELTKSKAILHEVVGDIAKGLMALDRAKELFGASKEEEDEGDSLH